MIVSLDDSVRVFACLRVIWERIVTNIWKSIVEDWYSTVSKIWALMMTKFSHTPEKDIYEYKITILSEYFLCCFIWQYWISFRFKWHSAAKSTKNKKCIILSMDSRIHLDVFNQTRLQHGHTCWAGNGDVCLIVESTKSWKHFPSMYTNCWPISSTITLWGVIIPEYLSNFVTRTSVVVRQTYCVPQNGWLSNTTNTENVN